MFLGGNRCGIRLLSVSLCFLNGNFVTAQAGGLGASMSTHCNKGSPRHPQARAMMMAARPLLLIASIGYATLSAQANESGLCERLQLKTPLVYTQDKAPRDLSGVLPVVVEKVNRVLEGVVDVEVEWGGGDLHGKVGEHTVQCKVTRLASAIQQDHLHKEDVTNDDEGRQVIMQCFLVPFEILDTDECILPSGHSMHHNCRAPAVCVNTIGSYECLCPRLGGQQKVPQGVADDAFWVELASQDRTAWEVSLNSSDVSSCPSSASTHGCCPVFGHSSQGASCRSKFRCPVDTCRSGHDCAPNAKCELADMPRMRPNFKCKCPPKLMGNGHACRPGIDAKPEPKVMFDGVTPTEETLKHNYYCGCTPPVVDACAGFPPCKGHNEICGVTARNEPKCVCRPGHVRDEKYGCVDETAPLMRLSHDPDGNHTLRLKQGDVYKEYAVEVDDENKEDYERSLKISYSQPLPPGCFTRIGEFHVNYTVATPWTSPPYARVTRKVIIDDIDECTLDVSKYESSCPEIIPQCDVEAGAICVNTIGSYKCRCPEYTAGDGFKPIHATMLDNIPEGFKGGTGCKDTSLPVIDILGPNPKVFKICKCGSLKGILGGESADGGGDQLCREQRKLYESSLRGLIISTAGAELCATHRNPNPKPTDCVKATDHTYKGPVDLSSRVVVGEPVQKSSNHWSVSYSVMDDAGNSAKTVWRDIIVEEVDLFDVEKKVRAELAVEKEEEIAAAVKKAIALERAAAEQVDVVARTQVNKPDRNQKARLPTKCPECPACKCAEGDNSFDPSQCEDYCAKKIAASKGTCTPGESPTLTGPINFLQDNLPPSVMIVLAWIVAAFLVVFVLRGCLTAVFNPRAYDTYNYPAADEHELQNAVSYYRSPPGSTATHLNRDVTPQTPIANGDHGFFSPQGDRGYTRATRVRTSDNMSPPFWSPPSNGGARSLGTPGSRQFDPLTEDSIYAISGRSPRPR